MPSCATAQPERAPPRRSTSVVSSEHILENETFFGVADVESASGFSPIVTEQIWNELSDRERSCSMEILEAQLEALAVDARDATRSFRNCDIVDGRRAIRRELTSFATAVAANRPDVASRALGAAFAGIQSFYTYSNYVELLTAQERDWERAVQLADHVWVDGPLHVTESRLLAHFSAVAVPNRCAPNVAPDLDKSTRQTRAGRVRIPDWGVSAHEAAVSFAKRDMGDALLEVVRRHPRYMDSCGRRFLFGLIPTNLIGS